MLVLVVLRGTRSIFDQPHAEQVHIRHARVGDQLTERFAHAADMFVGAEADILAFDGFPKVHWSQICPTTSGAPQQGDPLVHRGRQHLPQPVRGHPTRRRRAGRTTRRVGRRPRFMGIESFAKARFHVLVVTTEEVNLEELADIGGTTTKDRCDGRHTPRSGVAYAS